MAANDVYRAVLGFSYYQVRCINTILYKQMAADGAIKPESALAQAIIQDVWPHYKAAVVDALSLQTIAIRKISSPDQPSFLYSVDEPGDLTGDGLPPNSVVVITLNTDFPTRELTGRFFMSGIPEAGHQDGTLNLAQLNLCVTAASAMGSNIGIGGGEPSFDSGRWIEVGNNFQPYKYNQVRPWLRTLHSRTRSPE